jgi:hypothetical protein
VSKEVSKKSGGAADRRGFLSCVIRGGLRRLNAPLDHVQCARRRSLMRIFEKRDKEHQQEWDRGRACKSDCECHASTRSTSEAKRQVAKAALEAEFAAVCGGNGCRCRRQCRSYDT